MKILNNTSVSKFDELTIQDSEKHFKDIINNSNFGFFNFPNKKNVTQSAKSIFEKHKDKKQFVLIGIGGSALGPQMLIEALGDKKREFFLMDNTDSEYIFDIVEQIRPKEALYYVVSKSGGTAETMACYAIARKHALNNGITEDQLKNHFVFCTDPNSGQLREYVKANNYDALEVPSNVGGRFSVLTDVGLFPALFAGINIDELITGAQLMSDEIIQSGEDFYKLGYICNELYNKGIDQTVLMPYSSKLKFFSSWFVQLWAESLGKFKNDKGVGLTPIPAYGATDQHSQMQLFMEGPNNKLMMILEVINKKCDFNLANHEATQSLKDLAPYSLNTLIEGQLNGTIEALKENKREVIHLQIPSNSAESLGKLILFFESLTALVGSFYLEVDPFNQPGVELGKKYAFKYLKNKLN